MSILRLLMCVYLRFMVNNRMDEAIATRASQLGASHSYSSQKSAAQRSRMDPEGEEPPSLSVIDPNDPVGHVASSMPGKPPLQNNNVRPTMCILVHLNDRFLYVSICESYITFFCLS